MAAVTATVPQKAAPETEPRSVAGGLVEEDAARRNPARAPTEPEFDTPWTVSFVRRNLAVAGALDLLNTRRNIMGTRPREGHAAKTLVHRSVMNASVTTL